MNWLISSRLGTAFLVVFGVSMGFAQQIADPNFKPILARPAYTKSFPRVLFDEAHNNAHTAVGSFKPFAVAIGYLLKPARFNTANGRDQPVLSAAFGCAPGWAQSLGSESLLRTRQGESLAGRQGCPSRGGI